LVVLENRLSTLNSPRKITVLLAAVGLLAWAALSLGLPANSSADPALDSTESELLTLINDYRGQNGKGSLAIHPILAEAADWMVHDMATKAYFSHTDSLGRSPAQRIRSFGYPAGQLVGENAAAGYFTAESVLEGWKHSPGHNAAILGNYTVIGIAWFCKAGSPYYCYWVTDFGSAPIPAPTATPVPTPTPSPSPTPSPGPANLKWHDLNCSGSIGSDDAIALLLWASGSEVISAAAGCPALGEMYSAAGQLYAWGDVNCSGDVDAVDSVNLLTWEAGFPVATNGGICPPPGYPF
jgi:uncharacterized protein YkwD